MDWNAIARDDAHRASRPHTPWLMTMSWVHVLFAHWSMDPDVLQATLPAGLEIDTFDGRAWLTLTPLEMQNVGPRGLSHLPWVSHFLELNVRTYVRGPDGRDGIWFYSLDASNPLAVAAARVGFHLPYVRASMARRKDGPWHVYESERRRGGEAGGEFRARYQPIGAPQNAVPGTLDHWLVERYRLYSADRKGNLFVGDIQHRPWPLQEARAELERNNVAGRLLVDDRALTPERIHYAERRDVVGWAPKRL